jgi:hypothetical protein
MSSATGDRWALVMEVILSCAVIYLLTMAAVFPASMFICIWNLHWRHDEYFSFPECASSFDAHLLISRYSVF